MKTFFCLLALTFSLSAHAENSYDRRLTKSEMAKLLPAYVKVVENSSAHLPSSEDNQNLAVMADEISDNIVALFDKNNKPVGHRSRTIEKTLESLESLAAEIRAITPEGRQAQAADLVAGFKGDRDAGKISCRLGYFKGMKDSLSRVVKCEDNRSFKDNEYGEGGVYDVRRIILSIDAGTLAPLSVLRLEHLIAG